MKRMTVDRISAHEYDALIGVLAAVDASALAGILSEHVAEVIARRLRVTDAQAQDEPNAAYIHRRLDSLTTRVRAVSGNAVS